MAPLTISYDRAALNALLDDPDYMYSDQFKELDFYDQDADHECLGFLRSLLDSLTDSGAWQCTTNPEIGVSAYGEFTCDDEGFASGEGLTMQVFLNGIGICDTGIDSLWQLPISDEFTVFDLIDGAVAYLNEQIRLLIAVLCPPPPRSIALSVFHTDVVRGEATDNPHLTDTERARLHAATDDQIVDAIEQAWPAVEDRWYAIHDELQQSAVRSVVHP